MKEISITLILTLLSICISNAQIDLDKLDAAKKEANTGGGFNQRPDIHAYETISDEVINPGMNQNPHLKHTSFDEVEKQNKKSNNSTDHKNNTLTYLMIMIALIAVSTSIYIFRKNKKSSKYFEEKFEARQMLKAITNKIFEQSHIRNQALLDIEISLNSIATEKLKNEIERDINNISLHLYSIIKNLHNKSKLSVDTISLKKEKQVFEYIKNLICDIVDTISINTVDREYDKIIDSILNKTNKFFN